MRRGARLRRSRPLPRGEPHQSFGREERIARRDEREPEGKDERAPPSRARGRTRPRRPRTRTARIATAWKASTPQTPLAKSEVAAPTPSWTRGGRKRETASMVMCSFARLAATAPSTPTHRTSTRVSGSLQARLRSAGAARSARRRRSRAGASSRRATRSRGGKDAEGLASRASRAVGGSAAPGDATALGPEFLQMTFQRLQERRRVKPLAVRALVRASAASRSISSMSSGPGWTNSMP